MNGAVAMNIGSLSTTIMSVAVTAKKKQQQTKKSVVKQQRGRGFSGERKEETWGCVSDCGACCKLAKGPAFATPEEIFTSPSDIELYRSLIGPDGWCIHYEKSTRTCSIYSDRPYFCRVEPDVFRSLYGIEYNKFNKVACSSCRDTIKAVYGANSDELDNYNNSLMNPTST